MPILTLLAAASQLVGLALFSGVGAFESSVYTFPILIQPASWAFSIWGFIYLLSFTFAIYQVIPKNDNQLLRTVRIPASIAFIGSTIWLWLANSTGIVLWFTWPVLIAMAASLAFVVTRQRLSVSKAQYFSQTVLYPYAAWTGIAMWLNLQVLLVQQAIITNASMNTLSNIVLLAGAIAWSWWLFRRTGYSIWYGGVLAWASAGIVVANLQGTMNYVIATMAIMVLFASLIISKLRV